MLVVLALVCAVAWAKAVNERYWQSNQPEVDYFKQNSVRVGPGEDAPCGGCAE